MIPDLLEVEWTAISVESRDSCNSCNLCLIRINV
jgi:hypothetical protein